MKKCPYCAEEIQDEAIVCRFCGRDLLPVTTLGQVAPSSSGNRTLPALIVIGLFALASLVLIGARVLVYQPTPPSPAEILLAVESTQTSPTRAAVPRNPKQWFRVASWTGSGIKETESFTISSREWRIRWTTQNEVLPGAGIIQIYVHNAEGALVTLAANHQGSGSDVSYVRSLPGRYYLTVNAGNLDWDVAVEDAP